MASAGSHTERTPSSSGVCLQRLCPEAAGQSPFLCCGPRGLALGSLPGLRLLRLQMAEVHSPQGQRALLGQWGRESTPTLRGEVA